MTLVTRIDLIDAALLRIGCEPIGSEDASGAETHLVIFDSMRDYCLSSYPWAWNTVIRPLVRKTEPPQRYWPYQFELPDDMLGVPRAAFSSADCRTPFTRWELLDGTLQTDVTTIWLKMQKRAEPTYWPAEIAELVTVAIMAQLALSIREDRVLHDVLLEQAFGTPSQSRLGGLMGAAMELDAQSKPSAVLNLGANPLTAARFAP